MTAMTDDPQGGLSPEDIEAARALFGKAITGWRGAPAIQELFTLENFTDLSRDEITAFDEDGTISDRMARIYLLNKDLLNKKGQQ